VSEIKDLGLGNGLGDGIVLRELPAITLHCGKFMINTDDPVGCGLSWAYLHRDGRWHPATSNRETDKDDGFWDTEGEAQAFLESQKPNLRIGQVEGNILKITDGNGNLIEELPLS
jgi:hypothetical protein